MSQMIDFGIDLGTTNSAITKFVNGEVSVFSNPTDYGRNTLPSVVGFKKDKIFVGSKAKELWEKDPKSVVGAFKRKMGTSESFKIKAINESKTPIQLSAIVLKELKTFLPPSETINAAVITIPASFDMVQSNATKEAGLQAGFAQVVLLQEPIAASLAYANMKKSAEMTDGKWLVYDLGGGTFDAALINIRDGEMKVLDHEGDNFLGGTDFDNLIVEKLLVPKIAAKYQFENLLDSMKSASGKFNAAYYVLLRRAEEAKILLSAKTSAEIVVEGLTDDNDNEVDEEIIITRSEFNELIRESVDRSLEMVKKILTRNSLKPNELQFTLMVGGSTYIPYVRQRAEEILQIPVNCEIDPTTAVAVGAAHYAATKPQEVERATADKKAVKISIKSAYQKASKEKEELFSAKITGSVAGLFYRITRNDGGFDSGLKPLIERISEDLPLVNNAFNYFHLTVYDENNNAVETDMEPIGINSGFAISGQPLPEDICVEIDDDDNEGETKLLQIFPRNTVLPTKRTITRVLNRSLFKGDEKETVVINVLEGPSTALPQANKTVGYIRITGKNLNRDIVKGSDIELSFTVSESRDLTVAAYLTMADQEFKQTFNPKERHTPIDELKSEVEDLTGKLDDEIETATETENYEAAAELNKLKKEMATLADSADVLSDDDVTDKRYQIEDRKRKLAQSIDDATKGKRIAAAKSDYFEQKEQCQKLLDENGNDHERKHFNDLVSMENTFLSSAVPAKIQEKTDELRGLIFAMLWRSPAFLAPIFDDLTQKSPRMNDQAQAKSLIDAGRLAITGQNWSRLAEINRGLINLLPMAAQREVKTKIGF